MLCTSSAAATTASLRFAYATCKAGIQALMRNVACRDGPQGIRSDAIAHGMIAHYKFRKEAAPIVEAAVQQTLTEIRPGHPNDIASTYRLLAVGQVRFHQRSDAVDGGLTRRP